MAGYQSVDDYYKYSSSAYYIDKVMYCKFSFNISLYIFEFQYINFYNILLQVEIPMLLINAQDDPLVPEELLETPKIYVNSMYDFECNFECNIDITIIKITTGYETKTT